MLLIISRRASFSLRPFASHSGNSVEIAVYPTTGQSTRAANRFHRQLSLRLNDCAGASLYTPQDSNDHRFIRQMAAHHFLYSLDGALSTHYYNNSCQILRKFSAAISSVIDPKTQILQHVNITCCLRSNVFEVC